MLAVLLLLRSGLQTPQRGDLRLQSRGHLLKRFRRRRLGLLKLFQRRLLVCGGLAVLGAEQLFLGRLDLSIRFLCRRREFLQRRRAENFLPVIQR